MKKLFAVLLFFSTAPVNSILSQELSKNGENFRITFQYEMEKETLIQIFDNSDIYRPFLEYLSSGVRAYRISITSKLREKPIVLSGSIIIPTDIEDVPELVLFAHGTTFHQNVPSTWEDPLKIETLPALNGFILFLPDYYGYGESDGQVPVYFMKDESVSHLKDFIQQSITALNVNGISFKNALHLIGFSQGGHTVLSFAEVLENNGFNGLEIKSVSSIGGPIDIERNLEFILQKQGPFASSGYLTYLLGVYNHYYWKQKPNVFFQNPIDSYVSDFAEGNIGLQELNELTPNDVSLLITSEYLSYFDRKEYKGTYNINSVHEFQVQFPLNFIHSRSDQDVPFYITEDFFQSLKEINNDSELIRLEVIEGDHNQSGITGYIRAIELIHHLKER